MGNLTLLAVSPLNLSPIIYGVIALLAFSGALIGLWRGFMRQMVRSITVLVSAIVSYALIGVGYSYFDSFFEGKSIADIEVWVRNLGIIPADFDLSWMYNLDAAMLKTLLQLPVSLVVMPLLFVVCFTAISSLTMILYKVICILSGFRSYHNSKATRFFGMLLGLVQGVAVSGVLLMPILGITTIARDSVTLLNNRAPDEYVTDVYTDAYNTYVTSVSENRAIKLYGKLGFNKMYEGIATVELNGENFNMTEIVPGVVELTANVLELRGMDVKYLTPENEAVIRSMIKSIEGNPYFTNLISSAVRTLSIAYTDGKYIIPVNPPFDTIVNSSISVFHDSNAQTLIADVNTFSEIFFILARDGVFASFDYDANHMLDTLTTRDENGETTVSKVIAVIKANERTKNLVTIVTRLSVTVMSQKTGITEESIQTYDNIKTSINTDILTIDKNTFETKEEYVNELSEALDTTLKNNEIELEREIVDTMAEYIADNYSDTVEISDEEASDIILSYYDAYLEYTKTGKAPDNIPLP